MTVKFDNFDWLNQLLLWSAKESIWTSPQIFITAIDTYQELSSFLAFKPLRKQTKFFLMQALEDQFNDINDLCDPKIPSNQTCIDCIK